MNTAAANTYDEIPYSKHAYPQTHPDRLATMATFFGMAPAPVERCRVLELGCGAGGNLIPMALTMPGSTFLGIDLSGRHVAEGHKAVAALGLGNIELRHLSILDVDESVGQFDYLICHGVYSWVPDSVRDKILDIAARQLAANGVIYISYNTYPGWHLHEALRHMVVYHTRAHAEPRERIRQARSLLDVLARTVGADGDPHRTELREALAMLRDQQDYYLFHEYLEEVNQPVYFHQFAERAAASGLQYLGEAETDPLEASTHTPGAEEALRHVAPELVARHQFLDFLNNTQFRQSLLCRAEVALNRRPGLECLSAVVIASRLQPISPPVDVRSTRVEDFGDESDSVGTDNPILKSALLCLLEAWPRALPFASLCALARDRLGPSVAGGGVGGGAGGGDGGDAARDREVLGTDLLRIWRVSKMVELHVFSPPFVLDVSERPVASPLVRAQAAAGPLVTNLCHNTIRLDEVSRHVLRRLDGHHDLPALVPVLENLVAQGVLRVVPEGEPIPVGERLRQALLASVEQNLRALARCALLMK